MDAVWQTWPHIPTKKFHVLMSAVKSHPKYCQHYRLLNSVSLKWFYSCTVGLSVQSYHHLQFY